MAKTAPWLALEHSFVCGDEAFAATSPSVDALAQPDEIAGISTRVAEISDAVLTAHQHGFLPEHCSDADAKALMENKKLVVDRGLTFLAVPPEALEIPPTAGAGDAAGFQLHIRPGDVVIPVDETGLGISQVLHTVLMDVAREVNRLDATERHTMSRLPPDPMRYATVTCPHGATGAFDPKLGSDDAAARSLVKTKIRSRRGVQAVPERGVVDAAWEMSHEEALDEALGFTHVPQSSKAFAGAMRHLFGHGPVNRAGTVYCFNTLGGKRSVMTARSRSIESAISGSAAVPSDELQLVVARQRALHEYMSATLYSANYLRCCCLGTSDDAVSRHDASPADARIIFVTAGRATSTVLQRLAQVSIRYTDGVDVLKNYAGLHRIAVVALPTAPMEAELDRLITAADAASTATAGTRTAGAAGRAGSAVASLVHGTAASASKKTLASDAQGALLVSLQSAYQSFARVFRAKIPQSWITGGSTLADASPSFLWSDDCAAVCGAASA